MNQQPDKLFRDKLSGLSRPVPPAAWDRISQGLQPPVRRIAPWKIAASILLPLVAGAAIYLYWHPDTTTGPVADQGHTPYIQTPVPTAVDTASTKTTAPVVVPAPVPAQRYTYTTNTATTPKRIVTPTQPTEEAPASAPAPDKGIPAQTDAPLIADTQAPATTVDKTPAATTPATTAVVQERSMTLVFNARETEAYLDKNNLDEATEGGKDASTFKKLLQKARDLKTNQDPIGDLRLKKNEILALNFKNDKRGQNK
jgi:hypothetical protein